MTRHIIKVNRAPVLALWASVVAERLGHDRPAALTLGKALAGLNAQSKGRRIGVFEEVEKDDDDAKPRPRTRRLKTVALLGRDVPVAASDEGVRAVSAGKPLDPAAVERYMRQKFGESLSDVREAFELLADSYDRHDLETTGYALYEQFRPDIPKGKRGWGAAGVLDLDLVRELGGPG